MIWNAKGMSKVLLPLFNPEWTQRGTTVAIKIERRIELAPRERNNKMW
jgi:hypothetical protein